jgi:hypothetical protein
MGGADRAPRTIDMAQQNQTQGRSIELKTLVIAALAAVAAAVVTSFFWKRGTLISTALTPVIVTLTQEILRRPAEKISSGTSKVAATPVRGVSALAAVGARRSADTGRFSERKLLEKERGEDEASNGAGRGVGEAATNGARANGAAAGGLAAPPPPLDDTRAYDPTRSAGARAGYGPGDTAPASAAGETGEPKVYGRGPSRWRIALLTGIAAFAIAAVVLTVSELALGGSVGGDGRTSLFGGDPGSERADGGGSEGSTEDSSDGEQDASPSDSSESQSVPEEDSGGATVAPEEEPAPEEEEPVEPEEPAPVEPAPADPAR